MSEYNMVEFSQDVQSAYNAAKWAAILGTGYLLAKNPRVGLALLRRQAWAVAYSGVRLGVEISKIWWEEVLARGIRKPPPLKPPIALVKQPSGSYAKPGGEPVKTWRPPGGGGGAVAFFLFGGIIVNAFVTAGEDVLDWLGNPLEPESDGGDYV